MKSCILCNSDISIFITKGEDNYMKVDQKKYDLYQ